MVLDVGLLFVGEVWVGGGVLVPSATVSTCLMECFLRV